MREIIRLSFIILLFGVAYMQAQVSASGNSSADTPKISISKYKWSKQKRMRLLGGISSDTIPSEADPNPRTPVIQPNNSPPNYGKEIFVYEASFKNESGRELRGFVWEYIFLNPDGSQEIQRHEFLYPYKIGKDKKFSARNEITSPPTGIVNAGDLKKSSSPYIERVEIKCLIYDDDSIWKKAGAPENACQKLGSIIRQRESRGN